MGTAAAGRTAGTGQRLPRGVPAPGTTPCTRMGRDECRHVKQRRLELPQANGRVAAATLTLTAEALQTLQLALSV